MRRTLLFALLFALLVGTLVFVAVPAETPPEPRNQTPGADTSALVRVVWPEEMTRDRDRFDRELLANWRLIKADPVLGRSVRTRTGEPLGDLAGDALVYYSGSWCPGTMTLDRYGIPPRVAERLGLPLVEISIDEHGADPAAAWRVALAAERHAQIVGQAARESLMQHGGAAAYNRDAETWTYPEMSPGAFSEMVRRSAAESWLWWLAPATPQLVLVTDGQPSAIFPGIYRPEWGSEDADIAEVLFWVEHVLRAAPREQRAEIARTPLDDEDAAAADALASRIAHYLTSER